LIEKEMRTLPTAGVSHLHIYNLYSALAKTPGGLKTERTSEWHNRRCHEKQKL